MPYLDIPPSTLQPLIDTVFLAQPHQPESIWSQAVPILIGVAVAILGWLATAWLSRRNEIKGFEEAVMDRIRIDLNGPLQDYTKWLGKARVVLRKIQDSGYPERQAFHFSPWLASTKTAVQEVMQMNRDSYKWFATFNDYRLLLPNFVKVERKMEMRHFEIFSLLEKFIKEYDSCPALESKKKIELATEMVIQQARLRDEFFQFLQFECLNILKGRMKEPKFVSSKWDYLKREPDGRLMLVKVRPNTDSSIEDLHAFNEAVEEGHLDAGANSPAV